jgi:anti-sigma regulatory factor (Ser/Thr protein kinase)
VVHHIPHPGTGAPWEDWCRYEAAVNRLYAAVPAWALCHYDRRLTPPETLEDVSRTHPQLGDRGGAHRPNDRYQDAELVLRGRRRMPASPPEGEPTVELSGVSPERSRAAVRGVGFRTRLGKDDMDRLVLATSEVVRNAHRYGRPPVTLRVWAAGDAVTVSVTDHGSGPDDLYVGLVPTTSSEGAGLGLWIVHHLVDVSYRVDDEAFTVQLVAGVPAR